MSEPSIFFSEVNRRQGDFNRRAFLLGGITGLGLTALGARLALLQVVEAQQYEKLAASNQFNFRLVPPPRGRVLDRNGVVLASNRPNFRLMVSRGDDTDVEALVKNLSELVPIPPEKIPRLIKDIKRAPKKAPVPVMEDLSWEEFSRINVRAPELPGVTAEMAEVRVYPYGGAFAHVVGYVAKVTDQDVKAVRESGRTPDPMLFNPGFRIGRQGLEKAFDPELRGTAGGKKVEVDARGRVVAEDIGGDIPPIPGKEIRLTLDADIQQRALEVFGEESGAAVMIDCQTGDILCMASAPSFDANRFVKGLTGPEYRALNSYERKPMLDKCMSGNYPPGSTYKMMTALAALEAGIDPEARINCPGGWQFGGRYWRCHKKDGHGPQNMRDAIKNSCDVYFYQAGLRAGPDKLEAVSKAFGLGQIFDIGIPGQRKGLIPSKEWKRKNRPREPVWQAGDSVNVGIGQGYIEVNALQLAVMTARLANGKKALNPRLIKSVGGKEMPSGAAVPDLPFSQEHLALVLGGMAAVANEAGGTGFRNSQLGLGDVKLAGKSGSAQVRDFSKTKNRSNIGVAWKWRDHAWFVSFAPYDAPRYACAVLVEHGGGGGAVAAPKAREIMRVALLKDPVVRARIEKPLPMPEIDPNAEMDGAAPDLPAAVTTAPPAATPPAVPTPPAGGPPR